MSVISFNNETVMIRYDSTYDAAEPTPEVLATKRGTIHVTESSIWKFVPRSRIIGFAFARVAVFDYVRCEAVRRGTSCARRGDDEVRISSCRSFGRSDGLLI